MPPKVFVDSIEFSPPQTEARRRNRGTAGLCIILCTVVSVWGALYSVARVTPALFPGQQLPIVARIPAPLDVLRIEAPGPESVFNQPIVVLLAAVDARPNSGADLQAVNTDTIMLARIDPVAKDVRVLSVPRDLWVDVSYPDGSVDQGRINTSFAIGAGGGGGAARGMDHLQKDLERDFGIDIDYWVQLDFLGAGQIIDALGGVAVDIPEDLSFEDWWYSDDDVTHRQLSFPPGPQNLDGYHAVAFARLRAPDDDMHRIKRQQIVLQACFDRAFSSGKMSDPIGLWDGVRSTVKTNIPSSRVPGLALLAKQVKGSLRTYSLSEPFDGAPAVEDRALPSGAAVLEPVPEVIEKWVNLIFPAQADAEESITSVHRPDTELRPASLD